MRDKQKEETRQRVYKAALEVFRRDGVDECRIDDIAQKAEVSRGAFYFHFPTKEAVLLEFFRESEKPIARALAEAAPDASIDDVLDSLVNALALFWENDRALLTDVATVGLKVNANALHHQSDDPVRAALAARFKTGVQHGQLSGTLPPEVMSDYFLCCALAAMLAWRSQPQMSLGMTLKGVVYLFLSGARG